MRLKMWHNTPTTILFILLIAAALRLWAAFIYGDMWADEMFHITYSEIESWKQTWYYLTLETNPPLFTMLMKFWRSFTPDLEIWYRIPNVIIGTMTIYTVYAFTKKIFLQQIALYAAIIMALYPYHIFMSATIRGYAILMLLTIGSSYFLYTGFLTANPNKKHRYFYTLLLILLLYSHLTAIGIFVAHTLIIAIYKKNRIPWLISGSIALTAFSIWFTPWIYNKLIYHISDGWFFFMFNPTKLFSMFIHILTGTTHHIHYTAAVLLFAFGLIVLLIKSHSELPYKKNINFLLLLWGIPILGALMLILWHIKFITTIIPFTAILIAYLLVVLIQKNNLRFIIIGLIYTPSLIYMYSQWLPIQSWDSANTFITTHSNKQVQQLVINDNISHIHEMKRYYQGTIPYKIFTEHTTHDTNVYYITENYRYYQREKKLIQQWIANHVIDTYKEVFILESKHDEMPIREELIAQGWNIVEQFKTDLLGNTQIVYMKKN